MKYITILYLLVITCVPACLIGMDSLPVQSPTVLAEAIQSYDVDAVSRWIDEGKKVDHFFAIANKKYTKNPVALAIDSYYSASDVAKAEQSLAILRCLIKKGGYVDDIVFKERSNMDGQLMRNFSGFYYIFNRYDDLKRNNATVKKIEPLIEIFCMSGVFNNLQQGLSYGSLNTSITTIATSYAKALDPLTYRIPDKDRLSAALFTIMALDSQLLSIDEVLEEKYSITTDEDRKHFFREAYLQEEDFKESFNACIYEHMHLQLSNDQSWSAITMQDIRAVMPHVARYYRSLKNDPKKLANTVKKHGSLPAMFMYLEMHGMH